MTAAEWTADGLNILLIVLIIAVFIAGIIAIKKFIAEGFIAKWNIWSASVFGSLFMAYLVLHVLADLNLLTEWNVLSDLREILPEDWAQIFLVLGLVVATGFYALMAFRQAKATKEQADASVKMAKEMREQRVMASRPVIILKAFNDGQGSHFEIYNAGNGTALEVEVVLHDQNGQPRDGKREGFLRAGDTPISFYTTIQPDVGNSTFYVISEYQGILSTSAQLTWYQTKLPCKLSVSGKVIGGKLEFLEVTEEKRIRIFKELV